MNGSIPEWQEQITATRYAIDTEVRRVQDHEHCTHGACRGMSV